MGKATFSTRSTGKALSGDSGSTNCSAWVPTRESGVSVAIGSVIRPAPQSPEPPAPQRRPKRGRQAPAQVPPSRKSAARAAPQAPATRATPAGTGQSPKCDPILAQLRAERKRQGLSQTELAQRLGRSTYQTVHQWECGVNEPVLGNLRAWAAALGFDLALTSSSTGSPAYAEAWEVAALVIRDRITARGTPPDRMTARYYAGWLGAAEALEAIAAEWRAGEVTDGG